MIKMENVKKEYRKFSLDCSLKVSPGSITGLVGPNGAGKSTAFKAVLGLIRTDGGEIEVLGKHPGELETSDREKIGAVLADSGFSGYLSIQDLLPVLDALYSSFDRDGFLEKCDKFNLPMNQLIKEFSTGMKRKLQVAAAISHNAKLLILDEPTAGMDVIAREELLEMLREYMETEDRAILISSHISGDLEGLCDDIYLIHEGKIMLHEETDVLLDDYGLLKMSEEQYQKLEKEYLLRVKKEDFGYAVLTNQKRFYQENYPEIVIEKGSIDELIMMMIRGEAI